MTQSPTLPLRVVVTERQALIRLDLVEMLGARGCQVIAQSADLGETAVLALLLQPDLVILDQSLRRPDKLDPVQRLQRSQFRLAVVETVCRTVTITTPGLSDPRIQICKPFDEHDLFEAMDQALRLAECTGGSGSDLLTRRRSRRRSRAKVRLPIEQPGIDAAGPEHLSIAG